MCVLSAEAIRIAGVGGAGWYAAFAARVQPGSTVAVVGDGAVGLMGAHRQAHGADRIIAMSRHKSRQDLALEFGAARISGTGNLKSSADYKRTDHILMSRYCPA